MTPSPLQVALRSPKDRPYVSSWDTQTLGILAQWKAKRNQPQSTPIFNTHEDLYAARKQPQR